MSFFKKNNFTLNPDILKTRIRDYEKGNINIISSNIKNIVLINNSLKTIEENNYLRDLSKISLLLEPKFKDNDFLPYQKELMIEVTFSEYEYLKENLPSQFSDFNDFQKVLDANLDKIIEWNSFMSNYIDTSTIAKNEMRKIKISSKYMDDYNNSIKEDKDVRFAQLFGHEEVHAIGDSKKNNGLIPANIKLYIPFPTIKDSKFYFEKKEVNINVPLFLKEKLGSVIVSNQNESFTESISFDMLQKNFGDLMKNRSYIYLSENDDFKHLELETKHESYLKVVMFSDVLLEMYKKEVLDSYFAPDKNMVSFFNKISEKEADSVKYFFDQYTDFVNTTKNYGTKDESVNIDEFLKLEECFKECVKSYFEFNNFDISSKEYKEIKDVISKKLDENNIFIDNNKISENEILKELIFSEYEQGIIKTREDIIEDFSKNKVVKEDSSSEL